MVLVQGDENIAILRPDAAGIEIGPVGAADRQADIVHDGAQFIGRDHVADAFFHMVEQAAVSSIRVPIGRTHMQPDLAGIHGRKEILSQERHQAERDRRTKARKPHDEEQRGSIAEFR